MTDIRPAFSDLGDEVKATYGNGIGPSWYPRCFREWVTDNTGWFFPDKVWREHDFDYVVGRTLKDRVATEWRIIQGMFGGLFFITHTYPFWLFPLALFLALFNSVMLILLGHEGFARGEHYPDRKTIIQAFELDRMRDMTHRWRTRKILQLCRWVMPERSHAIDEDRARIWAEMSAEKKEWMRAQIAKERQQA